MSIKDRDQSLSPVLCFGLPAKRKKENYENLKINIVESINSVFCLNQSKGMTDKYFIAKKKALKKGSLNKNCTNSAKFHKSGTLCCRFRKTSSQIFCALSAMH